MPLVMIRLVAFTLLLACCTPIHAGFHVIRDSIGCDASGVCDPSNTNGLPGGLTTHSGSVFNTPGIVLNPLQPGHVLAVQFVIFGRNESDAPENDLEDILGNPMEFHLWTDGVQGGTDSFASNPRGLSVSDHTKAIVNGPHVSSPSYVTGEAFGQTGPVQTPDMFTTFLVSVDLTSFGIDLDTNEYVISLIQDGGNFLTGGLARFRINGSKTTGDEDLFLDWQSTVFPGYIQTQLEFPIQQYAARVTLGNGDFDGDDDVDGRDFLEWQRNFGGSVTAQQDANGNGLGDAEDLDYWQSMYGDNWAMPLTSSVTVPEPGGLVLIALAATLLTLPRCRLEPPNAGTRSCA